MMARSSLLRLIKLFLLFVFFITSVSAFQIILGSEHGTEWYAFDEDDTQLAQGFNFTDGDIDVTSIGFYIRYVSGEGDHNFSFGIMNGTSAAGPDQELCTVGQLSTADESGGWVTSDITCPTLPGNRHYFALLKGNDTFSFDQPYQAFVDTGNPFTNGSLWDCCWVEQTGGGGYDLIFEVNWSFVFVDSCTPPASGDWTIINGDACTLNVADTITGNLVISDGTLEIQGSGTLTVSGGYVYISSGSSLNLLSGGQLNG